MNNLQSSETEHRLKALEQEIELLKTTIKHRGRALAALALTVAALAIPVAVLIPIFSTDWSYGIEKDGKVSFHIASRPVDWSWLSNLFPPSTMAVLLIAAAYSLTGHGDKIGLLLTRYMMSLMTLSQPVSEASKADEDKQ